MQLIFTLLHLNSGRPVGVYARLTSLFILCRTATADAQTRNQPALLAYLMQMRSLPPLPLPPPPPSQSLPLVAAVPHSLFSDFNTAFPFVLPAATGWTGDQNAMDDDQMLVSLDDVIVSAMVHPRTSQEIGRMSARQLALLLATAFAPPPLPPPPQPQQAPSVAAAAFTSARAQHANATRYDECFVWPLFSFVLH